jgi:hypothetical protein
MKRKLVEAEKSAPEIARQAVERVRALYAVERLAKDASAQARQQLRGEKSRQLLAELYDRLLEWKEQLLPSHPMGLSDQLCPGPVAGTECLLYRWRCADRQQHQRTRDEAHHAQSQKLAVRWQPARRKIDRDLVQPDQHLPQA